MPVPRVAAIHDLSGLGKCSLTAAIPVLAAMGVQACPLPTAALSSQTGFSGYACVGLGAHLEGFAAQWKRLGVVFDGVYTGFLCDEAQARQVGRIVERLRAPGALVLVDPVLGDDGRRYPVFGPGMCEEMKCLVRKADVITPNLTEACLLAGADYESVSGGAGLEPVWAVAERLARMGPGTVVITGVHRDGRLYNLCYESRGDTRACVSNRQLGGGFSGTGNLLASVLCGELVKGGTARAALEKAAKLFEAAVAQSVADGTDPNEGIAFEPYLSLLMEG